MTGRRNGRTVHDLRRENRAALLQQLYFNGPMSRQELGPALGLSSGSISNVAAELAADGLVEEAGSVGSVGGRPRTLLRISPGYGQLIGVDVGETRVRVELLDLSLTELARTERPLVRAGHAAADIARYIGEGITEVLATAGAGPERLLGVGVGVPGIVARDTESDSDGSNGSSGGGSKGNGGSSGAVVHGQTIGWDAVPLESLLRETVQLPAHIPYFIDNGAKTLGQAEMWFGAGRGVRSAVVVLFGSGVGACVVAGDVARGRAVEWGHLTVRVRGRACRCGALGCLEAYAGAEALLERWQEAGGGLPPGAGEEGALTAMLAAAYPQDARAADPTALTVLEETAEYLGAGLADLINLFQPERILVGGWAGLQLGERFLASVRTHITKYALTYPAARVTLALGTLGPDAVTVGAAMLPLAGFFARGGHRPSPAPETRVPPWRTALDGRAVT
ncbi:ROK family transcriptional regulator [Actinomycetota bacterium Odt1-20B]